MINTELNVGERLLTGSNMQSRLDKVVMLHAKQLNLEITRGKLYILKGVRDKNLYIAP